MSVYSFLNVKATISGPGASFSIGSNAGVADEGITVEPTEDKDTMITGASGDVMHSLHAAKPGTIKLRLLKTSPVNNKLSLAYNYQTENAQFHGQNVILITDIQRGDAVSCVEVAFARNPSITYSKDGQMMEWAFNVGKLRVLLGAG